MLKKIKKDININEKSLQKSYDKQNILNQKKDKKIRDTESYENQKMTIKKEKEKEKIEPKNKIIGIHKGCIIKDGESKYNRGTYLKYPLNEIKNEIKMEIKIDKIEVIWKILK